MIKGVGLDERQDFSCDFAVDDYAHLPVDFSRNDRRHDDFVSKKNTSCLQAMVSECPRGEPYDLV